MEKYSGLSRAEAEARLRAGQGNEMPKAKDGGAGAILSRALDAPAAGNILLLQPTAAAAESLPELIDGLQKKGLEAVPTGSVLGLE